MHRTTPRPTLGELQLTETERVVATRLIHTYQPEGFAPDGAQLDYFTCEFIARLFESYSAEVRRRGSPPPGLSAEQAEAINTLAAKVGRALHLCRVG